MLLASALYYNMVPYYLRHSVRDPFAKFQNWSYDLLVAVIVVLALLICALEQENDLAPLDLWNLSLIHI